MLTHIDWRDPPRWLMGVLIGAGVLIVSTLVWLAFFAPPSGTGTPVKVHPGMYDLRKEAQKARLGAPKGSPQSPASSTSGF